MKVAIVCDWLTGTGGAERVVYELHRLYPEAPIYTSQYDARAQVWHGHNWFADADIRTGWLQKLPKRLRKFLPPLRALYFSRLNLNEYDLVISSSGAEAKGVKTKPGSRHICYLHSPTHYYWIRYDEYLKNPGFGRLDPLARLGLRLLVGPLRRWDRKAAQRPDYVIANSSHTAKMIKQYYGREAEVIFPPVDVERFAGASEETRHGFITAGRQTPYKRFDLAVKAFADLDMPLLVMGNGPDHRRLERLAGRKVTFKTNPTDDEIAHYFKTSLAFILPGMEDFGIVAVEALAAGTPVIAYQAGGALDYVVPGQTGVFFKDQTAKSLEEAIRKFAGEKYEAAKIQKAAQRYSAEAFRRHIKSYIDKLN